jgi:hypothetical protein
VTTRNAEHLEGIKVGQGEIGISGPRSEVEELILVTTVYFSSLPKDQTPLILENINGLPEVTRFDIHYRFLNSFREVWCNR